MHQGVESGAEVQEDTNSAVAFAVGGSVPAGVTEEVRNKEGKNKDDEEKRKGDEEKNKVDKFANWKNIEAEKMRNFLVRLRDVRADFRSESQEGFRRYWLLILGQPSQSARHLLKGCRAATNRKSLNPPPPNRPQIFRIAGLGSKLP